jgi:hypothetical protein
LFFSSHSYAEFVVEAKNGWVANTKEFDISGV